VIRDPNSDNSGEPGEGLENAEDLRQAWWPDNMPGVEFPTGFPGYIKVCFTSTNDAYEQHSEVPAVGLGF